MSTFHPAAQRELADLRSALATLTSPGACRRAGKLAARAASSNFGLAEDDASAVLEIACCVARDGSDEELASFLRTGRLPDLIALSPRQMEHVRGGRMDVTTSRGIPPEFVVTSWRQRSHHGT